MKRILLFSALLALPLMTMKATVDPNFYIYLCFGQSNMEGNAQPEAIDRQYVDPRFQTLACVDFANPARTKGQWYTAYPPIVRQGTGLGMADYFGRTMVKNLPENVRVGVVDVAIGGTKIEGFLEEQVADYIKDEADWLKNYYAAYDNNPYRRLVDMARVAQQSGVIKGILLHQGESNNTQTDWPQKVKTVYDRLIADLGLNAADVPLLVGETLSQAAGGYCWGHNAVIATVPSVIPNAYVISSAGCPGQTDGLHFTAAGYRTMGQRYAKQALSLMGIDAQTDDPTANMTKTLVASIDYTAQSSYPYYRMGEPAGSSYDVKDGAMVIENTKEQEQMYSLQPFVLDLFSLEEGVDYVVSIDMETKAAGNYWLCVGTWDKSMANYGLSFDAGRQTKEVEFPGCTVMANGNAHILFQCGKFIGTVKIYKVELYKKTAATGISTAGAARTAGDGACYDLHGRRVTNPSRGIYVVNGKKVIIR